MMLKSFRGGDWSVGVGPHLVVPVIYTPGCVLFRTIGGARELNQGQLLAYKGSALKSPALIMLPFK